ncbi:MAG: release factor glutamine methyltransferase [Patescibacteria group bacterium]|nr:release factor glutamine methyltransferase [Patescibacteria group bacterium]
MTLKTLLSSPSINQAEAETILAFLLGKNREYIIAHQEIEVGKKITRDYKRMVKKRQKHYPLAYLLGYKEFYGEKIIVNKHVLVPRPETEGMIDYLLTYLLNNKNKKSYNFLDIGTGSGAIIIALAKVLKNQAKEIYENSNFLATDISQSALKVAKENIKKQRLDNKIKLQKSDLLKQIPLDYLKNNKPLIITANLPYLSPEEAKKEPTISREPRLALSTGLNGVKLYKRLFIMIKKKNINHFLLLCEINPTQKKSILKLKDEILKDRSINLNFLQDLSQQTRFFLLQD